METFCYWASCDRCFYPSNQFLRNICCFRTYVIWSFICVLSGSKTLLTRDHFHFYVPIVLERVCLTSISWARKGRLIFYKSSIFMDEKRVLNNLLFEYYALWIILSNWAGGKTLCRSDKGKIQFRSAITFWNVSIRYLDFKINISSCEVSYSDKHNSFKHSTVKQCRHHELPIHRNYNFI